METDRYGDLVSVLSNLGYRPANRDVAEVEQWVGPGPVILVQHFGARGFDVYSPVYDALDLVGLFAAVQARVKGTPGDRSNLGHPDALEMAHYPEAVPHLDPDDIGDGDLEEVGLTLEELIHRSHQTALEKGWYGPNGTDQLNIGERLLLVTSELVEAHEEYRNGHALNEVYEGEGGKPEGFPIELADAFIRLADLCGRHKINLRSAIEIKMAYNAKRPYRHGGKLC